MSTRPAPLRRPFLALATWGCVLLASCTEADPGSGVGGVLVVAQVEVSAGTGIVLVGGTRQLQAVPRTSTGLPVPGRTIAWSSANTAVATVSADGVVTGITVGPTTITATVDGITGQVPIQVQPVPVASVEVLPAALTLPAGQSATLVAIVRDSAGGELPGRPVTWTTSNPAVASVSATGVVTGAATGSASITASTEGRSGSAVIQVVPGAPARLGFLTQPGPAIAGAPLTPAVRVAFLDAVGTVVPDQTGTITLSLASSPQGATLGGTTTLPATGGIATFPGLSLTTAGTGYALRATASGVAQATSDVFSVAGASPVALAIAQPPAGGAASGAPLTQQPVIELRDGFGNRSAVPGIQITASLASGPGTLSGAQTAVTDGQGRAAFSNLAIVGVTGTYVIRFEATGLAPVESAPLGIGAGAPTQVTFTTAPPAVAQSGIVIPVAIQVQIRDAAGNPVAQGGVPITAAVASGSGTLAGSQVVPTGPNGAAVFSNLVVNGLAGPYTLSFSAPNLTPAVSNPIVLGPGLEAGLAFVTAPAASAINGVVLGTAPTLQLRDLAGNPVPKAGVPVEAVIRSGPGGVLQGTIIESTGSDGRVAFANLLILGPVGTYTLGFRSTGLTDLASGPIALTAGPAAGLAFATSPPLGAVSGTPLAPQPAVRLVDQSGNAVAQAGTGITASLNAGPGSVSGALNATTNASGVAAFSDLTLNGPPGQYVLRFAAAGLTELLSPAVTMGAGIPSQLAFATAVSGSATNGAVLSPQPAIQLRDINGDPVAVSGVTVSAELASGNGSLLGTLDASTDGTGRASFSNLQLQGLPGSYVIRFTAAGLPSLQTGTITLAVGPATQLLFVAAPPASATSGSPFGSSVTVRLADVTGNLVPSDGIPVTAAIASGTGATLGGTTTQPTTGGVATFSGLTLTGTAGNFTLSFSSAGVTPAVSGTIALQAAPPAALAWVTQPPASAQSGAAFSPAPTVRLEDAFGNPVATAGVGITAALTSGDGAAVLAGASATTGADGHATFSALMITGPAGAYSLSFSAPGLTGLTFGPLTLSAGSASQLAMATQPSGSATSGQALGQQPVVRLRDGAGNPVAQAGVPITLGSAGGAITASAMTVNTDGTGQAAFAGVTITGASGTYNLNFSSPSLTGVSSSDIVLSQPAATTITANSSTSQSATVGTGVAAAPSVLVTGAGGVPVAGVTVTFTVTAGGGTITPASPASVPTNASGIAAVSEWVLGGTVGTNTVTASVSGLAGSPVTFSAEGTAPTATTIAANSSTSQSATVGTAVAAAPSVLVTGAGGVPVAGVTVTFAVTAGGGTITPSSPAEVLTNASGIASLSEWVLGGTVGTNTVTASASGLAGSPVTFTANGTAPPATDIAANSTTSQSATVGTAVAEPPSVLVTGAGGVPVPGVTVTFAVTAGGGALIGSATVTTNGSGVATIGGWTLGTTAGTNTVTATASGLAGSPVSFSATGTPDTPAGLSIATQPGGAVDDTPFTTQPVVRVVDQHGNVVTSSSAAVTAELQSGTGALAGSTTVNSVNGVATFTNLRITGTGSHVIRFTSPGLTPVTSGAFTVDP